MKNSGSKKQYFNPKVTVDVVIFTIEDNELKVLLINRMNEPFLGVPALPGGFIHEKETALDSANRVLRDKAGVENVYIEQLYTFDSLDRDPRGQVLSVTYFALVPNDEINIIEGRLTENPEFVSLNKVKGLAFDHEKIISYALKRLHNKIQYSNIAYSILPKLFTLSQLQKTYEVILGKKLDKRNFRKKFEKLDLIEQTKEKLTGIRQRPAVLYKFKKHSHKEVDKFI